MEVYVMIIMNMCRDMNVIYVTLWKIEQKHKMLT